MEESIIEFIRSELNAIIPNTNIEKTTNFKEVGLDSIQSLKFIKKINDKYGIKIKFKEIYKISTVNDLVQLIQEKTN